MRQTVNQSTCFCDEKMAGRSPSFKELKEEETQTIKYNSVVHSPFIQGKTGGRNREDWLATRLLKGGISTQLPAVPPWNISRLHSNTVNGNTELIAKRIGNISIEKPVSQGKIYRPQTRDLNGGKEKENGYVRGQAILNVLTL